jgi:hypothetical protein
VLPEEADPAGGVARAVDSSLSRVEVRLRGAVPADIGCAAERIGGCRPDAMRIWRRSCTSNPIRASPASRIGSRSRMTARVKAPIPTG